MRTVGGPGSLVGLSEPTSGKPVIVTLASGGTTLSTDPTIACAVIHTVLVERRVGQVDACIVMAVLVPEQRSRIAFTTKPTGSRCYSGSV